MSEEELFETHRDVRIDSGDSEICQNSTNFLENNMVTNLIIHTTVSTGPLDW